MKEKIVSIILKKYYLFNSIIYNNFLYNFINKKYVNNNYKIKFKLVK